MCMSFNLQGKQKFNNSVAKTFIDKIKVAEIVLQIRRLNSTVVKFKGFKVLGPKNHVSVNIGKIYRVGRSVFSVILITDILLLNTTASLYAFTVQTITFSKS